MCVMCINDEMKHDAKCNNCGERCEKCNTIDDTTDTYADLPCDTCAHRKVVFSGDNTSTDFGRWLFDEKHQNYTVLAHNMKGFDGYFLLEYLISNSMLPSKIIYAGSKIMHLQVDPEFFGTRVGCHCVGSRMGVVGGGGVLTDTSSCSAFIYTTEVCSVNERCYALPPSCSIISFQLLVTSSKL